MKNNLPVKIQITYIPMAIKNIDFNRRRHVALCRYFFSFVHMIMTFE